MIFRVAVDQVDSLRRQILLKDEEVKRLRKHCDHEEVEKIKIVQKLAQAEEEIDQKTFYVRNLNSQLSNKADTLEALRIAKRDIGNTYKTIYALSYTYLFTYSQISFGYSLIYQNVTLIHHATKM